MNEEKTINFLVEGNVACFRRPEFSDDLVTYDVMPPVVAARLIDVAFPSIANELYVSKITVMNPISSRWKEIRTARGLRRALVLLDVAYLVQATLLPSSADQPGIDLQSISANFFRRM
ncbi:CRISPR-associated protein Cas5 [Sphingomonas sp. TX0543]|uniref:CRISPR-associated protein Cas5 n=1 Tax=unclassified Sphingomonas TaxID=196159 RepID=UPI0010FA1D43|nr:CRISPR-associated protein Cas5 [Sphingomonas sp. 3P27F8]